MERPDDRDTDHVRSGDGSFPAEDDSRLRQPHDSGPDDPDVDDSDRTGDDADRTDAAPARDGEPAEDLVAGAGEPPD
jgi:hypothetical protein